MARTGWISPIFTFTTLPVTLLTFLVFGASLFSSIYFFETLPVVPQSAKQHGLDLDAAYRDLQVIAALPHPYNSHQNDVVRKYLLDRVNSIAASHPAGQVQVVDDVISNGTWANTNTHGGVYYEGNNILVRIPGTSSMPAVLFSAHFDSVSTAPGATDDGMSVATLLQLIETFAKAPPKRDVIFNINNGEEDGLHGAHAFLEHPWASLASSFLNLEGAGGGGRPILFRSSSASVARAFWSAPHPHGNVAAEDAFSMGVIRSGTDFSVYTDVGIPGLDLAFYQKRALYHTKDDSVPTLRGKASLWNMLESAYFTGKTLADDGNLDDGSNEKAVYFDLFGEALIVAPIKVFMIINILLLVVGPIFTGGTIILAARRNKLYWSRQGWVRFPIALVFSAAGPIGFGLLVNWINPFIVHTSPYTVLLMGLSASFTFLYLPLRLLAHYRPVLRQKTIVLLELYVFTYLLLILDTVAVSGFNVGALYPLTFLNAGLLLSLLLALSEQFELPGLRARVVNRSRTAENEVNAVGQETSERTPLLSDRQSEGDVRASEADEENQLILWAIQFVLAFPFSAILILEANLMQLGALRHTLSDGSPSSTVYLLCAVLPFLTVIPLSPFAHKLHHTVFFLSVIILTIATLNNVFAFPFTTANPVKLSFRQQLDFDNKTSLVQVTGPSRYLGRILEEIPSAADVPVSCAASPRGTLLNVCSWKGPQPNVATGSPENWMVTNATLVRPGYATIRISPSESRFCKIRFDAPISNIHVHGSGGTFQKRYPMPAEGLRDIQLWSRTWGRTFDVEVGWEGDSRISGQITCGWDDIRVGKLPAFDEVKAFIPNWSTVTKAQPGLLEVTRKFSL